MSSQPAPTRPDAIRGHNLAVMLDQIHRNGALTRAELTQRLGVSRSTVGALVAELTNLGLVEETVPTGGAGVGRPSHVVGPSSRGPFAVAVDVDVAHVTVAAVALGGAILASEVVQLGPPANDYRAVADLVVRAIPRLQVAGARGSVPAGVGVSVPGTVDRRTGKVAVAPNLEWHDAPLGAHLRSLLPGIPVSVGNDADLAALAEHRRGSARDCDDVVFVLGRIGVGAGIITGGGPLRGYDGHAGEIGHDIFDPAGPPCHCGKNGCVETYVGDGALLTAAGRPGPISDAAVAEVFAAARDGEPLALAGVRTVAEALGRALASLVNTLNPQRVLLGGSLSVLLDLAQSEIERSLAGNALEAHRRTVQLVQPALGANAPLLGAAEIAFAPLLTDPLSAPAAAAAPEG